MGQNERGAVLSEKQKGSYRESVQICYQSRQMEAKSVKKTHEKRL